MTSAPAADLEGDDAMARAVRDIAPFGVTMDSMAVGKQSRSLFLLPKTDPPDAFERLHATVASVVPGSSRGISNPHIGLGSFSSVDECERYCESYERVWEPLAFEVRHLFLVELRDGPEQPWTVTAVFPLAGVPDDEEPFLRVGRRTQFSENPQQQART